MAAGEARDSFAAVCGDSSKKWDDKVKGFLAKLEKKGSRNKETLIPAGTLQQHGCLMSGSFAVRGQTLDPHVLCQKDWAA